MLLDLTTGLPRTLETGGTPDTLQLGTDFQLVSGASLLVDGNLVVNGTTTTVHSEQVNLRDNHLFLNADYTTPSAQTGGFVVNVLPSGTSDSVAGAFTAGVAAVSNPTVVTTGSATFSPGDIVQISDADDQANDGVFEVESHVGTTLTIRGIGTAANTQDWFTNQFVSDSVVAGTITLISVNVLRGTSAGAWETFTGSTTNGLTYSELTTQGSVDLQEAYEAGNTITTDGANGSVQVVGSESFDVSATGGFNLTSPFNFDSTSFDVQMTGTNGFSIDGTAASNLSVDSGNLTLETTTSGNFIVNSAGTIDLNSDLAGSFTVDGSSLTLETVNSGNVIVRSDDNVFVQTNDDASATPGFVQVSGGNATGGNSTGGQVTVRGGDGFGTGSGAPVNLLAGDSGAGATGNGGGIALTAGDAASTNGSGGDVTVTLGDGSGTGVAGQFRVTGPNDASEGLVTLTSQGAGGDSANVFVGSTDPSGAVDGLAGSLFLRDTGATGELYVNTSTGSGTTWEQVATGATTETLQEAYEAGNTIVTDAGNGDFDVSGTEAISLDASSASNFTVAGSDLTLSTTGGGNMVVDSAGTLDIDSNGVLSLNANSTINIGNDADAQSINIGTGAAARVIGIGNTTASTGVDLNAGTAGFDVTSTLGESAAMIRFIATGTGGESVGFHIGSSSPNGVVSGLSGSAFFRDTGATGELWINTSAGGTGTDWEQVATGGTTETLQEAYEAGNTIVTDAGNGDFDVSGTEAISLDAGSASNFTVDGGNLTLSTTTSGTLAVSSVGVVDIDGNSITADATAAISLDAAGASNFTVSDDSLTLETTLSGVLSLVSAGLIDVDAGTSLDIDVGGTAALDAVSISMDATAASNFTVDGADLTLATSTSGSVLVDGVDGVEINSSGGAIEVGNDADANAINIGTGAAARTITIGNGTGATSVVLDNGTAGMSITATSTGATSFATVTTSGANGDSVEWFVSDLDPSAGGGVAAPVGSTLWRDAAGAGTTGELWLKNGAANTAWEQVATGTTTETLQEAYEAGNTIVTDAGNGDFDVSGTEAISLDASSASNFTVDGADLALETTTSGTLSLSSADDIQVTFEQNNTSAMVIEDGAATYMTFDSTSTERSVAVEEFLDIVGSGAGVTLTAGQAISAGDVVTIEATSGDAILADANTGVTLDGLAIGIAAYAAADTTPIKVYTVAGSLIPVNFGSAPAAADNGKPVFVSTTAGQGTITAPTSSGTVTYIIGILQGADGVSTQPTVLYQPQFISVRP